MWISLIVPGGGAVRNAINQAPQEEGTVSKVRCDHVTMAPSGEANALTKAAGIIKQIQPQVQCHYTPSNQGHPVPLSSQTVSPKFTRKLLGTFNTYFYKGKEKPMNADSFPDQSIEAYVTYRVHKMFTSVFILT